MDRARKNNPSEQGNTYPGKKMWCEFTYIKILAAKLMTIKLQSIEAQRLGLE